MRKIASFVLLLLFSSNAFAMKFSNQFVEFELPLRWNCSLEGAEWVCQSTDDQKKRDAIIVLAAKLKGEQDSLEKYQDYLGKSRVFNAPNGKSISSQPKYSKVTQINGTPWVDSIHMESEIPGFYTRYLAAIKQDIGVLVTYSINKNKYQEYLSQFEEMVKSLKVFRKAGGVNSNANQSLFSQTQMPGSFTNQSVFGDAQATPAPSKEKAKKTEEDNTALYLVIGAAVAAFILYKKKKNQS